MLYFSPVPSLCNHQSKNRRPSRFHGYCLVPAAATVSNKGQMAWKNDFEFEILQGFRLSQERVSISLE